VKRIILVVLVALVAVGIATAQVTSPTADVLGAHNVYGRGCVACHAPHSGAAGNGGKATANGGNFALWGEDMSPLYGQTLGFGNGGTYAVTLPNYLTGGYPASPEDGYFGIITCLSCHDGNLAKTGMMKGTTVETVTIAGATFNPPTLLGNDGSTVGNYQNDHPVGPTATVGCGGPYNWDCTINTTTGAIVFNGPNSAQFIVDYFDVTSGGGPIANLVKVPGEGTPSPYGTPSNSWVSCTTCHDQHDMLYFNTAATGPAVIKPTHFFVRGWYNPGNTTTSNSAAQFCRSCHGGESNEAHGQIVPTT
jgi:hypothetical protein